MKFGGCGWGVSPPDLNGGVWGGVCAPTQDHWLCIYSGSLYTGTNANGATNLVACDYCFCVSRVFMDKGS